MSIFIQEVLGLLNRNQKKITLDKTKDWFEFGKLYQSSSLNNKSGYTPKMDPFVIKWGDLVCQATEDLTRTLPGEGKFGYIPVYTDPSGFCSWDTLKDSIITQNILNTIINIAGNLVVDGDVAINGGDLTSTSTAFNLLNQSTTIDFGSEATNISVGKADATSTVTILGTQNSQVCTTGALVVNGAVGIAKNLNLCGDLKVSGVSNLNGNVNLGNTISDVIRLYGTLHDNAGNGPLPNQVLVGQTGGQAFWQNNNVSTLTYGAIWRGNSLNIKEELLIGPSGNVLTSNGTTLNWTAAPWMVFFNVAGNTGTPFAINQMDTLSILGGTGLSTVTSSVDTVTINHANYGTAGTYAFPSSITTNAQGHITSITAGTGGSGVTQIVAGTNITISPTGGTGIVTINSTGGGAVGSLTTTGTTGAATLIGTVLNIPDYSAASSLSLANIGSSPNSTGATLISNVLTLQPANSGNGGVVSTGTQSFSGIKTFINEIIVDTIKIWRGSNNSAANIAIGLDTLTDNTGNQNTVLGYQASSSLVSTASFTAAVGYQALRNVNGNNNAAVGHSAGLLLTIGSQNTFIGSQAGGFTGQLISAQNSIAIGYQAITTANNQIVLGNTSITETVLRGNIKLTTTPTTSASTYDILTINASGVIQKIPSTSVGVTSVSGTGSVSGLTLTGTVTSTGSLTLGGSLTLTSLQITTGLGFTPYNATNPSGFTSFAEPGIFSSGGNPTLASGVTAAEVRTLIGAGTPIVDADFVKNTADTYTSSAKITQVITLSQAEYDAIVTPLTSTLYIIL